MVGRGGEGRKERKIGLARRGEVGVLGIGFGPRARGRRRASGECVKGKRVAEGRTQTHLVDTTAFVDKVTGGGRLAGVDVADDDEVHWGVPRRSVEEKGT